MHVSKWGNSLAVRLPKALVEDLGLKPGDELEIVSASTKRITIAGMSAGPWRSNECEHALGPCPRDMRSIGTRPTRGDRVP